MHREGRRSLGSGRFMNGAGWKKYSTHSVVVGVSIFNDVEGAVGSAAQSHL
jgi:hypothetical protein